MVYYGSDDSADKSRLLTSDGKHVIKWMVSRVEDRNGNAMMYDYDNSQKTGEIYISGIHYTYNSTAKSMRSSRSRSATGTATAETSASSAGTRCCPPRY